MARTARVHLLTDDYAERLSALYGAIVEASGSEERPATTALEGDPVAALRNEYDALREEAEREGVLVELRSVPRSAWRRLREKHPPRTEGDPDDVKGDRMAGVNLSTVEDDLVYASLTFPPMTSRGAFDEWVDDLSPGDFQTLLARAFELTTGSRFDPKPLPA